MASGTYLYEVRVDSGSTLRAAQNVRQVFQREMATISTAFNTGGGGALGQLASGAQRGLAQGLFGGLRGGLAAGAAGVVAGITAGELAAMARFDRQLQNSEQALASFAGNAVLAEQRIEAVQAAAGGAITRFEALRIANLGAALGFADTSQELDRVTTLATKAAAVLGGTVSGNIENLALAASNLSFERLDTLGISADQVRSRFAELSQTMDKSSAFMLAALEVGERTFANIDAQASAVDRLAAAWADLRATGGSAAAPFVEGGAGLLADGLRGVELLIGDYQRVREAQSIFERGMQSADPVVKAHADQIAALGGELVTGRITYQQYQDGLQLAINTLAQYDAQSERSRLATADLRREIINTTDAAEHFKATVASIAGTDFAPRFSPSYGFGDNAPSMRSGQSNVDSLMDGLRLNTEEQRRQLIEEGRANENLAREQSRLAKQTANETANAWQRAAQNVQSAWERAVGGVAGIPGVTGRSQVTELDMRLADFGLYQSKPDEFLRRAEDQLLNNVDRGIDRNLLTALTSQSTGFDLGKVNALPNDLLAQLFGQEYESGRLFSTPLGQGLSGRLFDTGAAGAGIDQANAAGAGADFIKRMLGEDLPAQFATVAGDALKGLRDGLTGSEDLPRIGADSANAILREFTSTMGSSTQVEAAANSLIAEFFKRYQEALTGQ